MKESSMASNYPMGKAEKDGEGADCQHAKVDGMSDMASAIVEHKGGHPGRSVDGGFYGHHSVAGMKSMGKGKKVPGIPPMA
jgi:hypothetical protein